jgi:hypothetical protein
MPANKEANPTAFARILRLATVLLCFSAIGFILLSFLLPFVVSHAGEQQMIDAPGVFYEGVCCVEAPWHFFQRLIWFPIAPFLLFFSAVAAILSGLFKINHRVDTAAK